MKLRIEKAESSTYPRYTVDLLSSLPVLNAAVFCT
jgi:hypothetical protein